MTQHTPGALQALGGVIREHLPSGETVTIATDVGNYASFVTAAELVRRWNTHEVMLEALKAVGLAVANNPTGGPWEQVAAAIAAAEKESN